MPAAQMHWTRHDLMPVKPRKTRSSSCRCTPQCFWESRDVYSDVTATARALISSGRGKADEFWAGSQVEQTVNCQPALAQVVV